MNKIILHVEGLRFKDKGEPQSINESMVSLVLRQYMRRENGTEFSGFFFLSCLFE